METRLKIPIIALVSILGLLSIAFGSNFETILPIIGVKAARAQTCTPSDDFPFFDFTASTQSNPTVVLSGYSPATRFTLSNVSTITKWKLNIKSVNAPGTFTTALYQDDGSGHIGALVPDSTSSSSVTTAEINEFVLPAPITGLSGSYWLVMSSTNGYFVVNSYSHVGYKIFDAHNYLDNYAQNISVHGCDSTPPPYTETTCLHNEPGTCRQSADCSLSKVQATIDASSDGDGIYIPAGTCDWGGSSAGWTDKRIHVFGAGQGNTIINLTGSASTHAFVISTSKSFRISGMTFTAAIPSQIPILIEDSANGYIIDGFRLDHVTFPSRAIITYVIARGVVDHCQFNGNSTAIEPGAWLLHKTESTPAETARSLPTEWGSNKFFFIEDNVFRTTSDAGMAYVDNTSGSSVVFRYNMGFGGTFHVHSGGNNGRGAIAWEVYNNEFNGAWYTDDTYTTLTGSDSYPGMIRAGTGLIYNNRIWNSLSGYVGNWSFDNDRSFRNMYGSVCNGGAPAVDGNLPLYTGTHTGGNGASSLIDNSKSWTTNELAPVLYTGVHSGSNGAATLSFNDGNAWRAYGDQLSTMLVHNTTDGSWCKVTASAQDSGSGIGTAACTLTSGTRNNWNAGDTYVFTTGDYVYNLTTGASCEIVSNTSNTVICPLSGGTRQTWNAGDSYSITNGWPCMDQIGRIGGTLTQQTTQPAYIWNNGPQADCTTTQTTCNGSATVGIGNNCGAWIKNTGHANGDIDYCLHSPATACGNKAGWTYTAYTYPHPLITGPGPIGDGNGDVTAPSAPTGLVVH